MMKNTARWFGTTMGALVIASTCLFPVAAQASEDGKRNTTLGLAAAAAALLLTQKNKLPGLVAAGGAVYAYTQYQKDVSHRHQRERAAGYIRPRGHRSNRLF